LALRSEGVNVLYKKFGQPVPDDVLDYIKAGKPMKTYIAVALVHKTDPSSIWGEVETLELTERDIVMGGFVIDRYSVSGSKLEVGNASAAELTLTLNNDDGRFDDVMFEGSVLTPEIRIPRSGGQIYSIPMGVFTVDEPPRNLSTITLKALDGMVKLDKPYPHEWKNISLGLLLQACLQHLGIVQYNIDSGIANLSFVVEKVPATNNLTCRQVLMWIAELTGT